MYETQYSYFINPATKKFLQTNEAHSPITTPPSFYFGDRPTFTLSFPANTISAGDYLVAVLDNENRFLDTKQATGLNPVMAGVLHEVTSEEADSQSLEIQLFDYSKKFADVINGHDNAVTCLFTVYLKSTDGDGNFTFVEIGQTLANGEPTVTSPECIWDDLPVTKYYTREELDAIYNQFLAGVSLVVEYSNLAKSYAVGGTGTREGEATDNAKYYAEMASQAAQAVTTMYGEIQTLATQVANTKDYIDRLVVSIATDIRDISAIAASVTEKAAQVANDTQYVRQAKSSIDASVQFVTNAKSTIENLATQVSQNAVNVANDKDAVQQLASQVTNAANQVAQNKADAKGYSEAAATTLTSVQEIQTDVTQKQTAITTMKNTIQGWYTQIQAWYNSINAYMEQMLGWWTDVDTWQQQVSADKDVVVSAKDTAVHAKNDAVSAKTAAETAQEKAETAQEKAEAAQDAAEDARDEAVSTLANKRDILQTLVTSSATSLVVEAGKSYNWTVSSASMISLAAADKVAGKETRIDIYIDLQDGGSVTGDGVTISDAVLQSGWYKLIWDGTNATLYSTKTGGAASVITIPAATTTYTLQDNTHYQQVPSAVPTYTLPAATMDGLVHEITVLVDFLHVTSCSFVDAGGVPVTLQSAISPQIGEAYIFRCYWYEKWRVVPLKIRNAATASSATGVLEVTDAVAGDALAMKMTAPRSVVVNQQISVESLPTTYNMNSMLFTNNGDGTITVSGQHTSGNSASYRDIVLPVVNGHSYIFSGCPKGGSYSTYSIFVIGDVSLIDTGNGRKITVSSDTLTLRIRIDGTDYTDYSGLVFKPQLVDLTQYFNGDTTLIDSIQSWDDLVAYDPRFASYMEYNTGEVVGVQPSVKVTGKNLFDKTNPNIASGSMSDTGDTNTSTSFSHTDYIAVPYGAIITCSYPTGGGSNPSICFYTANKTFISGVKHSSDPASKTYTCPVGCAYIRDSFRNADIDTYQIELGSTATTYEPYYNGGTATASAPLFGIGTVADEYEAVAGVTTRNVVTYTFTENTNWRWYSASSCWQFEINANTSVRECALVGYIYVNSVASDTSFPQRMTMPQRGKYVYVYDANYVSSGDLAAFKAHMAGKTLYLSTATPTTSSVTPSSITLQNGDNVAMQTDGGRTLAELALTYENLPTDN